MRRSTFCEEEPIVPLHKKLKLQTVYAVYEFEYNNVKYIGMETLKNSDGIPLEPPYEKDGKWLAEDGRGCVLDFDTYEEAVDFQKGLTPDSPDRVVLFSDED